MTLFFAVLAAIGAIAGVQELITLAQGYLMSPSLQFGYAAFTTASCVILFIMLVIMAKGRR